jgi:hypothetical protein
LVDVLEKMRRTLVFKYTNYEEKFDGSCISGIVPDLIIHLQDLFEASKEIGIEPLFVPSTVERSEMLINIQEDKGNVSRGGKVEPDEAKSEWRKRKRGNSIDSEHPDEKRRMNGEV